MYTQYIQYLSTLYDTDKYRKLLVLDVASQPQYLDFSTNDYLALSRNPKILEAATLAGKKYGAGATGSRLLSGNNDLFESFELQIAKDKKTQAALIFNTGFVANFAALSSLLDSKILGAKPIVFFDKLNHSSLYQAVFLSKPELVRYNHNDMQHLSYVLDKYRHDTRPKFIVTETIFGMDGDILPIDVVALLAKEHKALLYLDEAHATGVFGVDGYGLSTTVDFTGIVCIIMGTFSKALGCSGGYIACDQAIKDFLINKAHGFIYSTANSPLVIGAAAKAWGMVKDLGCERNHLLRLAKILRDNLVNLGFRIGASSSHIVPIILGSEESATLAKEKLLQNGIIVSCIRPPTVPQGNARIRIGLTANHKEEDIWTLIETLKKI